tara:strand:- start:545 stop:787 length:243 start_codon:yes stop_codon:yes gene_type:complete
MKKFTYLRHNGEYKTITTRLTSEEMSMIEYALLVTYEDDTCIKEDERKDMKDAVDILRWKIAKKGLTNSAYVKFVDKYID